MNQFETLSDDPILHICTYLPRNDLLKLSEVDKTFYRIITTAKETIDKIPLVINFKSRIHPSIDESRIDEITALAHKREFTALEFQGVFNKLVFPQNLISLMQHLSGSAEDIEIRNFKFDDCNQFRELIQMFLPKLKTL